MATTASPSGHRERIHGDPRGRPAERPTVIPLRGWRVVVARVTADLKRDNVSLLAAGVAFFGMLAQVPALVALLSVYGLVADPADIRRQRR